jgi:hypothetical protein
MHAHAITLLCDHVALTAEQVAQACLQDEAKPWLGLALSDKAAVPYCLPPTHTGYHRDGGHRDGYSNGRDKYGYDEQGYDEFGWDKYG